MPRLVWAPQDADSGIDRGVFFGPDGVEAWDGLVSVVENTPELRTRTIYIDGIKSVNQRSEDSFSATILAYTYPPALDNKRLIFGFSYRVQTGDSYKIHLIYNALAKIAGMTHEYEKYDPFSISITTTPTAILESKPTAHLVVDAKAATPAALAHFEDVIYGSDAFGATLPSPDEIVAIFDADPLIKVIDNGDGTFTVDGPDNLVDLFAPTEFEVITPTVVYLDGESYTIRSF